VDEQHLPDVKSLELQELEYVVEKGEDHDGHNVSQSVPHLMGITTNLAIAGFPATPVVLESCTAI